MLEAYGIAKWVARTDATLHAKLAPAIDFFTKIARLRAKPRKKRQDDRDYESSPPWPGGPRAPGSTQPSCLATQGCCLATQEACP
jgi:hypothetical protein